MFNETKPITFPFETGLIEPDTEGKYEGFYSPDKVDEVEAIWQYLVADIHLNVADPEKAKQICDYIDRLCYLTGKDKCDLCTRTISKGETETIQPVTLPDGNHFEVCETCGAYLSTPYTNNVEVVNA